MRQIKEVYPVNCKFLGGNTLTFSLKKTATPSDLAKPNVPIHYTAIALARSKQNEKLIQANSAGIRFQAKTSRFFWFISVKVPKKPSKEASIFVRNFAAVKLADPIINPVRGIFLVVFSTCL